MRSSEDVLDRTTWLFTRDHESVCIQVERRDGGWRLVLHGPGEAWRAHDFSDTDALTAFRDAFERDLRAAGFELHAADRRSGQDRRRSPRAGSTDRRR